MTYLCSIAFRYIIRGRKAVVSSYLFPLILLPSASHTPYMGKELVARRRAETRRGDSWVNSLIYRKKETRTQSALRACSAHSHGGIDGDIKHQITA